MTTPDAPVRPANSAAKTLWQAYVDSREDIADKTGTRDQLVARVDEADAALSAGAPDTGGPRPPDVGAPPSPPEVGGPPTDPDVGGAPSPEVGAPPSGPDVEGQADGADADEDPANVRDEPTTVHTMVVGRPDELGHGRRVGGHVLTEYGWVVERQQHEDVVEVAEGNGDD